MPCNHLDDPFLTELDDLRELTERLADSWVHSRAQCESKERDRVRQQAAAASKAAIQSARNRARRLLQALRERSEELNKLRAAPHTVADGMIEVKRTKLQQLMRGLEAARRQCVDLHELNEALAAEIASQRLKLEANKEQTTPSIESMTWEQRRALIIAQLEREDAYEAQERGRLVDVVAETDRVVQDRDREIAELRELLRQRPKTCTTSQTVMGAAQIAELLDTEPLIQEERMKLQALRHKWEERICQAEIELSLARAKLARDQKQLQPTLDPRSRAALHHENENDDQANREQRQ